MKNQHLFSREYFVILSAVASVLAIHIVCPGAALAHSPGDSVANLPSVVTATIALASNGESSDDPAHEVANEAKQASTTKSKERLNKTASAGKPDEKTPYNEQAVKHYNRGVELHQSGFLNQAIAEYKAAIEADGRMEEAQSNLGVIYAAQRNYPRAKDAFLTALSLKPNRPTTLNGLGTVLYAQGHIDEAKEKWEKAISIDPTFASAYYNLGNAYESEKNLPKAVNCYSKAISASSNMADAYYRIGAIYNKQHHNAQASALLRKAVELAPDSDFVREANRIEGNLENDFAKNENDSHHLKSLNAAHKTSSDLESNQVEEHNSKMKKANKKKDKSAANVEVFVQTPKDREKAGASD